VPQPHLPLSGAPPRPRGAYPGDLELAAGSLQITSGITRWQENLNFFTVHLGSYLYRTQILEANSPEEFQQLKQDFFRVLAETPEDLIPLLASRLGDRYYTVHDIFQEEKEQIFADLLAENRTGALNDVGRHFDDAVPILKAIAAEKLPFPRLYQALGEITLDRRLVQILRRVEAEPEVLPASEDMLELLQEAVIFGFKLESREGGQILLRILNHHLMDLAASFDQATADSLEAFLKLQRRIPITWEPTEAQNFFFSLMKEHFAPLAARAGRDPKVRKLAETLVSIADALDFNPAMYQLLLD
jgi:hypothetical protein